MKIKLSKYWWNNLYVFLILGAVIVVSAIWFQVRFVTPTGSIPWWVIPSLAGLMFLGCMDAALHSWRFLMTMEVHENGWCAFLFGKLKCEVSAKQEVYYAIFDCRESQHTTEKYIAVSNSFFVYEKRRPGFWSENRFIDYYDRTKQIIFPYNETTQCLFSIENWICVNSHTDR